jgi:surface antigen
MRPSLTRPPARRLGAPLALALLLAAPALPLAPAPAAAQVPGNAFGTDNRSCDRGAVAQVLSTSQGNVLGSVAGAALGGLLGNQVGKGGGKTLATIAGVVGGALAGGYVGRSMDPADQACVAQTLEHTPTNQTVAWQNPDSNANYWVTPTRTYTAPSGEHCREYTSQAVIDGRRQETTGVACRQPDGDWRIMPASAEAPAPQQSAAAPAPDYRPAPPPQFTEAEDRDRDDRPRNELRRLGDRELRDRLSRLDDEARQIDGERRAIERELDRRGVRY